jgi:hypothetical protein
MKLFHRMGGLSRRDGRPLNLSAVSLDELERELFGRGYHAVPIAAESQRSAELALEQEEIRKLRVRIHWLERWAVQSLAESEQEKDILARMAMRGTIERFEGLTDE